MTHHLRPGAPLQVLLTFFSANLLLHAVPEHLILSLPGYWGTVLGHSSVTMSQVQHAFTDWSERCARPRGLGLGWGFAGCVRPLGGGGGGWPHTLDPGRSPVRRCARRWGGGAPTGCRLRAQGGAGYNSDRFILVGWRGGPYEAGFFFG